MGLRVAFKGSSGSGGFALAFGIFGSASCRDVGIFVITGFVFFFVSVCLGFAGTYDRVVCGFHFVESVLGLRFCAVIE